MNSNQIPILTKELRELLSQHANVQALIDIEMRSPRPDNSRVSGLKRNKLVLRDQMQVLLSQLPQGQYASIHPALYVMNNDELKTELQRRQQAHRRKEATVGPGSFQLSSLASAVREVEVEIDRRELEVMFAPEEQLEMPLEIAA